MTFAEYSAVILINFSDELRRVLFYGEVLQSVRVARSFQGSLKIFRFKMYIQNYGNGFCRNNLLLMRLLRY